MKVRVSFERVQKALRKLPFHIQAKALHWALEVEEKGLEEVRKRPGLHDEPLLGERQGQRSIRLSKSYRLIYTQIENVIVLVYVLEINKHEY